MEVITTILAFIGFGTVCNIIYKTLLEEKIRRIREREYQELKKKYFT